MKDVKVIKASSERIDRRNSKTVDRIKVAAYCRVSTDSEEQLLSYNSQVMHYKQLVESNPEWELVDIYADEGITGTQTNKRLNFQRMINDAVEGRIDLVVTKSISRFARNTLDTLKYVRLLKEHNVAILFEKENINTLTMNGEMLLVILSSLAQQESESISSNVKMGLKMKMKRGELTGFHGCLGYDYDSKEKTISINEEEAETVRYIFKRYIEGAGCFVIAKELTQLGYKTKNGRTQWNDGSVRRIIKNEKYKGDILLGKTFTVDPITHRRLENMGEEEKYYIANNHEPIISEEIFEEAQKILKKRSSKHNNKGRGEKYTRKYAFSSLIECGFCGSTVTRRSWHSNSVHQKTVWSCVTATKKGKRYCPDSKSVGEQELQLAFVDAFNMLCTNNKELVTEFLESVEKTLSNTSISKELKRIQNETEKNENKLGKLVDMHVEGIINKETYEAKYIELSTELEKLKTKKEEFQSIFNEEKELKKRMDTFRKLFDSNKMLESFDREIFESVIDKIIFGKIDENGNKKPHAVTFVFKTGFHIEREYSTKKSLGTRNADNIMCSYYEHDTCGVRGSNTTQKMLVILVFKLFCGFYTFSKDEQNFENKQLMDRADPLLLENIYVIV